MKPKTPPGKVWVPGYTKDDGTRVNGYFRDGPRGGSGGGPPSNQTSVQRQAAQALKGKR